MSTNGGSSFGGSHVSGASGLVQSPGNDDRDVAGTSTFWNGFFGMLYTVNKNRGCSRWYLALKYTMEFLQLAFLMLGMQYGWQFNAANKGWPLVELIEVRPFMARIGHGLFVVFFVGFMVLLFTCVAIYGWVYYCFQNNKFEYMWPLRLARLFNAVFLECLDVMAMSLMLTAIDCRYYGWPSAMRLHSVEFPSLTCMSMPNVIYFIVAIVGAILFILLSGFNKLAQMDLNPITRALDAYAHPGVELCVLALKMLIVLGSVFLGDYRHLAVFWLLCTAVLCFWFWRWEPMVVSWVNYVRVGTFAAVFYIACVFAALQFPPDSIKAARDAGPLSPDYPTYLNYVKVLEIALAGSVLAGLFGALASFLWLRHFRVTIANKFRDAPPGMRARMIHKFSSPLEVELVSRCCRVWVDADTLQAEAVGLAERVLKAGLSSLPSDPFMVIWYTSFLVDVQGSFQSGYTQLQVALKLDPSFIETYAIFSHEQDHSQKSANKRGGQRDVLSDMEFQKSYRLALFAHKDTLMSLRLFWQLTQHSEARYEDLVQAVRKVDKAVRVAERTYRSVLQRNSDQPRLLRLYAKFLDRVKHDPWGAARWTAEAEKLELVTDDNRQGNMFGLDEKGGDIGAGHISRFSIGEDGEERALCVFNSSGIILMTNDVMREMFGYAKGEIKDKSLAMLMPPPFSEQALHEIKSFVVSGHGSVVIHSSVFVAVHKDRHMFAARISVVRISGIGEDSTFLAALELVHPEADTATLWILSNGQVLSADARFRDWFGHAPADLEGTGTAFLTPDSKELDSVLKSARRAMILAHQAAADARASEEQEEANAASDAMALLAESSKPAQKAEGIAQALAAAAAAPCIVLPVGTAATAVTSEWVMQGLRIHHKFAESLEVDVTVKNTTSTTFSMHVLTLRRAGADAAKPMPHMLVTNPAGAVMHVTEPFATMLGTTPKVLMANGNNNALEALMVQPFGLLHRAGLTASLPSVQPPAYSCRSGLSVLMPIADSRIPDAVPVKMQMKKRTGLDEPYFVCTLQPTPWDQALDERSLRLTVDEAGVIKSVGASPTTLFDLNPAALVGKNATSCIDILRGEAGPLQMLMELGNRSVDMPGLFWRVSVGLGDSADEMRAYEISRQAKTYPAAMTVVRVASVSGSGTSARAEATLDDEELLVASATLTRPGYELRLWRADMVTSVVEVDGNGVVVEGEGMLQTLYPPGAALGVGTNQMLGEHIRDFIPLGVHKFMELFDEGTFPPVPLKGAAAAADFGSRKKSNIKSLQSAESRRVGPPVLLHGRNRLDGLDMSLTVQIVRKGAAGAYLVIHPHNPGSGRMDLLEYILKNGLCSVDIEPRKQRRSSVLSQEGQFASFLLKPPNTLAPTVHHGPVPRRPSRSSLVHVDPTTGANVLNTTVGRRASFRLPVEMSAVRFDDGQQQQQQAASPRAASPLMAARQSVTSEKEASIHNWVLTEGSEYLPPGRVPGAAEVPLHKGSSADVYQQHHLELADLDQYVLDALPRKDTDSVLNDGSEDGNEAQKEMGPDGALTSGHPEGDGETFARDSNSSQVDEAANAHDDDNDYRRGQRLRKLNRIFNSDLVKRYASRLKWHTWGVCLLLTLVAIMFYVTMRFLIAQQVEAVEDLNNMGLAARRTLRAVSRVMDLGQFYQPYPNPYLQPNLPGLSNSGADLRAMQTKVTSDVNQMADKNRGIYEGFNVDRRLPEAYGLRSLWEDPVLPEKIYARLPNTENGMNALTYTTINGTFQTVMTQRNVSMFDGLLRATSKIRDILANGDWYNSTLKSGQRWIDWESVLYLRNNVDATFSGGYTNTLDGYAQVVVGDAGKLNNVQLVFLVVEGIVLASAALAYMWYLANQVETNRFNIYCVFMAVPLQMVRNLANARADLGDDDSDDDADIALLSTVPGQPGPSDGAAAKVVVVAGGGRASSRHGSRGAGGSGADASAGGVRSWGSRLAGALMFWRPQPYAKTLSNERRKLNRSIRTVLWLVWPFALWGVLIIIINALAHDALGHVQGPMMTFNIINSIQSKMWRVFYAVAVIKFDNDLPASAVSLNQRLMDAELDYTCMLFGHDGVPDQTSAHFTLVSQGISTQAGPGQYYLYDYNACLSTSNASCLLPSDPFYHYTMQGIDTLIKRVFDVVGNIIQMLQSGVQPTNSGPELMFVWKVKDLLTTGFQLLVDAYKTHVQNVYLNTLQLQLIALIITVVIMALYLVILYFYLNEVHWERKRITELMTQLPVEVDIEGLVRRAVIDRPPTVTPGTAGKGGASGGALTAADLAKDTSGGRNGGRRVSGTGGGGGRGGASMRDVDTSGTAAAAGRGNSIKDSAKSSMVVRSGDSSTPLMKGSGGLATLRRNVSSLSMRDNKVAPSHMSSNATLNTADPVSP